MGKIIVGTDFSEGSYVALELAIDIANKLNNDILLLWADGNCQKNDEKLCYQLFSLAEEKLKSLQEKYQEALIKNTINYELVTGKPYVSIAQKASEIDADMIIIGTHGTSGYEKRWVGSNTMRTIERANCPVLTIREGFDFHKKLDRIVIPITASDDTRHKIPMTVKLARIFDSEVHIVGLPGSNSSSLKTTINNYVLQVANYLDKENIKNVSATEIGSNHANTLIKYAENVHADLIIIMTQQEFSLSDLLLGPAAQQIVHFSPIPVLSIHPKDINSIAR